MKRHRTIIAFFALIAFLMNATVPFFAVYAMPAKETQLSKLAAVFGEKILICSGSSFKWVKLSDLQAGREKPAPHPDIQCALCFVAQHGKAIGASPVAIADAQPVSGAPVASYDSQAPPSRRTSPFSVRAPPVSFTA